jgi:hypothetical protein
MICRSGSQMRESTDHCAYSGRVPIMGVRLAMTSKTA